MRRSVLAVCVLALVAAFATVPAGALAQSAGDNQYQDPFANQGDQGSGSGSGSQGSGSGSSGSSGSGTTSSGTTSSGTSGSSAAAPSSTSGTSGSTAAGSSGSGTLPYTGFDAIFGGVLGAVLLLAGITVRASVRDGRRP